LVEKATARKSEVTADMIGMAYGNGQDINKVSTLMTTLQEISN